jgi:hypothetical protein
MHCFLQTNVREVSHGQAIAVGFKTSMSLGMDERAVFGDMVEC